MRQAIVIKNPKWEQFTAASDKFKALKDGENAVLVVRGRCKERRAPKAIIAAASTAIALLLFSILPATAQQSLIANLPSADLTAASTNWTAGNGIIGINPKAVAVFQLSVLPTNSTALGVAKIRFDNSDNGTDWVTNQYEVTCSFSGTNQASTAIQLITNTVGGKWLRVGGVANASIGASNSVTIQRFSISIP